MSQINKKVPYLKLVVNNGTLIDEEQELVEKQQALISMKLELQFNINLLHKRTEPIVNQIFEIEKQLEIIRGTKNDKRKSRETGNPWTSGDKT